MKLHQEALELREKAGNPKMIAYSLADIGRLYYMKNNLLKSLDYYHRSLREQKKIDNHFDLAGTLFRLIQINLHHGLVTDANRLFGELEEINNSHNYEVIDIYYSLSKALLLKHNKKLSDKLVSLDIFLTILKSPSISVMQIIFSKLNICELMLLEYKASEDNSIRMQIQSLLAELSTLSDEENLMLLNIQINLILVKLSLATNDFTQGLKIIEGTLKRVNQVGYQFLVDKMNEERNKLLKAMMSIQSKSGRVENILKTYGLNEIESEIKRLQYQPVNETAKLLQLKNYKHLMDPVRLTIVELLYGNNRLLRIELEKQLDINPGSLKNHLDVLAKNNLIVTEMDFLFEKPRKVVYLTLIGRQQLVEFKKLLKNTFLS